MPVRNRSYSEVFALSRTTGRRGSGSPITTVDRAKRSGISIYPCHFLKNIAIVFTFFSFALPLTAAEFPPAKDILNSVRLQQSQQEIDLQGQLRENDKVIPFRLLQMGPVIRWDFSNPNESLQLRLGEND